jgi:hypothetical protein
MKTTIADATQAQRSTVERKAGMLHSIFNLDEGPVTLIAPAMLSEMSSAALADLFEQFLRRAKRDANNIGLAKVQEPGRPAA